MRVDKYAGITESTIATPIPAKTSIIKPVLTNTTKLEDALSLKQIKYFIYKSKTYPCDAKTIFDKDSIKITEEIMFVKQHLYSLGGPTISQNQFFII